MSDINDAKVDLQKARRSLIHALAPIAIYTGRAALSGDPAMREAEAANRVFVRGLTLCDDIKAMLADEGFWTVVGSPDRQPLAEAEVDLNVNRIHEPPIDEAA